MILNIFGVYHSDYSRSWSGIFDAPCITKGRMMLCAHGAASEGGMLAAAHGRMRNRASLASELALKPNATPSELALAAYRRWGEDYPRHIEGPAITCVMDSEADVLVLSRDRMGEVPLFYELSEGSASFSDHPDVLLKTARIDPVMDVYGLRELFGLGPARTPGHTCYRDMKALEPGCALVIRGGKSRIDRYWRIEDAEHGNDARDTVKRTRELLEACVLEVAGLRLAVMLSGGLDSTALTALLSRDAAPLRSFSVDYQDNTRDFRANAFRPEMDAPYVAEAVRAFGTQHRLVTLTQQELAGALGRATSARGFPGMADIDTSLLLFSEQIVRYDRCVVSGECGDEVFCGYPWFKGDLTPEGFPWSGSIELREALLLPEVRHELRLREYVADVFQTQRAKADPGPSWPVEDRSLKIMQRLCFDYFMANLQERAVRMCEAAGVQVLTPLCDDRLVQYVYNVPREMKFMGGQEKGLFREAVADLLPEKLLRRTKSPYPKTCSPEFSRIVRGMALRLASEEHAPVFDLLDREAVRRIARSDLDPARTPWFGQLMTGPQLLGYIWQVNRWMGERNVRIAL